MGYILSIEAGTTSVRAALVDRQGSICALGQKEITQHYPNHGWVEHEPLELWTHTQAATREAMSKIGVEDKEIEAIGVTNQRETIVVWDRTTGEALWHAIVWQDIRTQTLCDRIGQEQPVDFFYDKTGLRISSYFSATKLAWILDKFPQSRQKAASGELCCGTIDTYLVWHLTNGTLFQTDVSNASRTLLFNIHTLEWDDDLLDLFRIPKKILPSVVASSGHFGHTDCSLFSRPIPLCAQIANQQASLFAHGCFEKGDMHCSYGTGCFLMMNAGITPPSDHKQLLSTIAWKIGDTTTYALEGAVFTAGSAINWLRDSLGMIREVKEIESLAASVPDSGGLYFVPAMNGLATPHWNMHAKGTILGITLSSNIGHFARATLEGIAYQVADIIDTMREGVDQPISVLKVSGGMSENNFFLQIQSDVSSVKIARSVHKNMTTLGAAFIAGLETGFWTNKEEIQQCWKSDQVFAPKALLVDVKKMRNTWQRALQNTEQWV